MPVPLRAPQRITGLVMKISKKIAEACHEIFPRKAFLPIQCAPGGRNTR